MWQHTSPPWLKNKKTIKNKKYRYEETLNAYQRTHALPLPTLDTPPKQKEKTKKTFSFIMPGVMLTSFIVLTGEHPPSQPTDI
jgi:hypothetical protein